jgi:replicative DNA helicase
LILKILLNKDAYASFSSYVDREYIKTNYRELSYLYNTLDDLHLRHNQDISLDEFAIAFNSKYPDADRQIYGSLLKSLQEASITPDVGLGIIQQIKTRREALKLSETAFKVAQGILPRDELLSLISRYGEDDHPGALPIKRVCLDLEEILDHVYKNRGLRWRLDCLNKSIGSLRPGDFGFIFARPESGKTTLLASEATQFAGQGHSGPVLWFNNEEQGEKVGVRIIQAYFGITLDQLTAKRGVYRERFNAEVGDRIQLFDEALLSKNDIEAVIKATQPSLVIYDQIDKIRGFTNDRDDLRLGSIYQWARELAKGGHAAIGVCQADGHAEGVRYLTMEHVANAKTSKQAEADFIIGIGKQNSEDQEYIRYLNISKNKLFGDEDSLPDLRHGRFEVIIEPQIARYKDIIKFD